MEGFTLVCHMQVEEKAIAQLLPYLLEGLKGSSPKEHRMATYMVIMKLIARSTPAAQLYNGALQTIGPSRGARLRWVQRADDETLHMLEGSGPMIP